MESNDYRLERWLAVILSLLFFLPFVARADEVLYTGVFHGDEVPYADGEKFLALQEDGVLVPVKITVIPEQDMYDGETEKSGKGVTVPGFEETFLLRGRNLHPGKVTPAANNFIELVPTAWNAKIEFNGRTYDLFYRCGNEECTLVLASGDITQDLASFQIERVGNQIATLDVVQVINFAGDLDHDGKLDLIADLARHWNEMRTTLWLSSAAKDGQLVAMTAEFSAVGC